MNRPTGMALQRWIRLRFAAMIALWVMIFAPYLFLLQQQGEARRWAAYTLDVIEALKQMENAVALNRFAIRAYYIDPQPKHLQTYRDSGAAFLDALQRARRLSEDNPQRQLQLGRVAQAWEGRRSEFADRAMQQADRPEQREAWRQMIIAGGREGWISEINDLLAEMRAAEQALLMQRQERQRRLDLLGWTLAIGGALALLAFSYDVMRYAGRRVIEPIGELTALMRRLAEHDHEIQVPHQERGDEIGEIARALNVFRQTAVEAFSRNWVTTHAATISARLQRSASPLEFAETLLDELAPLLGALVAAFFRVGEDGDSLELLGGYGFAAQADMPLKLGGSLLEQALRARRSLLVAEPPAGYLRVRTGLGEARPQALLVAPLLIQEHAGVRAVGVLEFGSLQSFSARQQGLLDDLLPIAALALDKLQRALRTQQLLRQTQGQAEELKASEEALRLRQEELRATNEQLQARSTQLQEQSQRLQASEEELRQRAIELQCSNRELRDKSEALSEQAGLLETLQRETQAKAEQLARASQYKSDFLANMSHELRTPLNSLLILSHGLADNEEGNLSAEQIESARIIHESGSDLLRLINDILDLSKVEAGKLELVEDELNLEAFAASLTRNFRHVARQKNLEFTVELAPGLPASIRSDGARLEQVLNNLLSNAFKFTQHGVVQLRIARPEPGAAPAGWLALSVSDSGIGIPADKLEKVFQAFEQVDASTSRRYGGTGLGLSIARALVRLLGGEMRVRSESGQGTTFTVLLPERTGAAVAPAPEHAAVADAGAPCADAMPAVDDDRAALGPGDSAILAIEDDQAFVRILVDHVRRQGYKALAALDGESGLALAQQHQPAGVLLDVMLPGMDGWSVLERLKANPATRHIPVHFISATDGQARASASGAVGYLTKPVTRESLNLAVQRLAHFAPDTPRRLLVVDDDEASRRAVRLLLLGAGPIEVLEAADGEQALQYLSQHPVDCIVLDLGLPGIDGLEFLERAARLGPVPPVVMYSAREPTHEQAMRLSQYTGSMVIKGARSPKRLLDEVSLFLHSIRPSGTAPPVAPEPDRSLSGRTVLVVDDDMRNTFALSRALRAHGLKVMMAQDGHKALRQLDEADEVQLVLMDIMMPGMDGYETMRRIRQQARFASLPIIALTAKAMRGDREKCLEAGANDYLSKPIDVDRLLSLMRVYLSSVTA